MPIITSPAIKVNGVGYKIAANSASYTEGLGEQTMEVQASGNNIEVLPSDDVTTKISMVKFSLLSTPENIEAAKSWKIVGGVKIVLTGALADGTSFSRTFLNCLLTTNYEINLQAGGKFEVEFRGEQAI